MENQEHILFEKVLRLLIELNELDKQGKNDSDEADKIREEMEFPLKDLKKHDQETLQRVSAALYPRVLHEDDCSCRICTW